MSTSFSNPKAIAQAGERIYREKFQKDFEASQVGKFTAINIATEQASLGETPEEALHKAKADDPTGVFHLIRVGFTSAFQVSHARTKASDPDWLFR
jgi:hypothetical protein